MSTVGDETVSDRDKRRRRAAWIGAGAAVAVVAVTVGVIAATRDDDSHTISSVATDGTTDSTTDESPETASVTVPVASAASTVAPTTAPASSAAPPSVAETAAPVTAPARTTAPTEPATTTTVAAPTTAAGTTTTVTAISRPIVAVDASGNALIVALDGTSTLLYDGPDPDDPPPTEGDSYSIDAVAVTNDRTVAFVGACCEPIVGSILRFALPDTVNSTTSFGHAPAISPDGTKVAVDRLQMLSVVDLDMVDIASTPETFLTGSGNGFVWLDDQRFVVLEALPDGFALRSMTLAADNTLQAGPSASTGGVDGFAVSLAGSGPGVVYVRGLTPAVLSAFDAATMQAVPGSDITLPGESLSAWMQDGELRWIDSDRHLHVGDAVVPGQYVWVR